MKKYITIILSVLLSTAYFSYLTAQTITSKNVSGPWEDPSVWIGDVVPGENNDVIINGIISVTNGISKCKNLTINSGKILQNGGGLGWINFNVYGNIINNGSIRNNPEGNSFNIVAWGNVTNNGEWAVFNTYFPAKNFQFISQASGKVFDTNFRLSDADGYGYTSGSFTASSDITIKGRVNLRSYLLNVGDYLGSINMNNKNLTLVGEGQVFDGTVKNTGVLTILDNARLYDVTFEGNTTLKGRGRIENGGVTFKGNLTVADTLQNGGGLGWLCVHVTGNLINNGFIRNNKAGNALQVEVWGDAANNGIWENQDTFFPGKNDQHISQSSGRFFNTNLRRSDFQGFGYTTGSLIASTDITIKKPFELRSYISGTGDYWGDLNMNNKNLTLSGDARIFYGTVKNTAALTIFDNAYLYDINFEGNTTLKGRGRIENGGVTFKGNLTVADTLQNGGGLGWLCVHITGRLTNNGFIRNNKAGNALQVEVWGDVVNNGIWENQDTFFPGKNDQHISQSSGRFFNTNLRRSDFQGFGYTTGSLIAATDITIKTPFELRGYIAGVGDYWGELNMNNKNLTLAGDAHIFNGKVKNAAALTILDNAYLNDITFEGNTSIKGRGCLLNGNVNFIGTTTVMDTLQNCGGYGWIVPIFYGDVINYGTIKNNDAGNSLDLDIRGNAYNYGVWKNSQTYIKTEGVDRKIAGKFNTSLNFYKTGEPKSGNVFVDGTLASEVEMSFYDEVQLIVPANNVLLNEGALKNVPSIVNFGTVTSTHDLNWYDPLCNGLNASITLFDRGPLENVKVTNFYNSFYPTVSSSVKQWWRIIPKGKVGNYKITFKYDEALLNGNDENTLEVYVTPDSGRSWKKISNPLNIFRDPTNNQITVGNETNPVSEQFGDFMLCTGGIVKVPSISMSVAGRSQIRVGPPNRYSVSYWNNSDFNTDKFFIKLNTNRGVHIKSVISKEIEGDQLIETPIDSLNYDGQKDEVLLLVQALAPKECRTFDVILNAEPDPLLSKPNFEPITFTAAALWIGGAIIEEFVSNTMVEGCYEIWRPVKQDETLTDASVKAVKNSMSKAVTVENGVKGIAKKGAEEIIKKTGRVVIWPAMLAKDIYDCMGNAVKGMKDYVNGNFEENGKSLTKVTSWDPNAKEGPAGYGSNGYIASSAPMTYTIYFENKKEATAPAWKIVVIDTLDANVFDVNSVQFGAMSHSMGIATRNNNILKWEFENIELPPNQTPPEGEGWVKFIVHPKNNLPTGTVMKNRAVITFDLNKPLATNLAVNTLDFDAPVTKIDYLKKVPGKAKVELKWNADDKSGSGVKKGNVFMSVDDGPYTLAAVSDSLSADVSIEPYKTYKFYVLSEDNVGNAEQNPVSFQDIKVTGVNEEEKVIPLEFDLAQNYPNPFNPLTKIRYSLVNSGQTTLRIYDLLGREVKTLVNGVKNKGIYEVEFDAADFASGIYFYRLVQNNNSIVKKMMILK